VASAIVGEHGTVVSLTSAGTDPHSFSPSPSQVAAMVGADLVIANGLGLEASFVDILHSAEEDGAEILYVGEFAEPQAFEGSDQPCEVVAHDHAAEGGHDDAGTCDPHVWMDPDRVALGAEAIADALSDIDSSVDWGRSKDAYLSNLDDLGVSMSVLLDAVPAERRVLVTNHDSLGYFADRFGFSVAATVIPGGSTLANPSSADLADLVGTMRGEGIDVIFADTTDSIALAEAVAAELGSAVKVVELYTGSIGGPGSGAETLIAMLQTDAQLIADALR